MFELIVQMSVNMPRVILKVELYTSAWFSLLFLSLPQLEEKRREVTRKVIIAVLCIFNMLLKNVTLFNKM